MKSTVTVTTATGVDPFIDRTTNPKRKTLRKFINMLRGINGDGHLNRTPTHPTIKVGTQRASAVVTCAAVANADTVTINGQAVTATQANATATVTCASALAADTVTVNGSVFVGTAGAVVLGALTFSIDTSDTAAAVSLVAQTNAYFALSGIITANNAAGVVTFRAVTAGTAGNSLTLASSNNTRLAVSAATLANGAAIGNNQFDFTGTNAQTAAALGAAFGASSTSILVDHVIGGAAGGTITLASVTAGESVNVGGVIFYAVTAAATGTYTDFSIAGSDTADAVALAALINAHPSLKDHVLATSALGVVTVRRYGTSTVFPFSASGAHITISAFAGSADCLISCIHKGTMGNAITIATSNGTRLAIAGSVSRLAGGTTTTNTY